MFVGFFLLFVIIYLLKAQRRAYLAFSLYGLIALSSLTSRMCLYVCDQLKNALPISQTSDEMMLITRATIICSIILWHYMVLSSIDSERG